MMPVDEELYKRCLEAVAPAENERMRRNMSAYHTTSDAVRERSARGKQDEIVDAVKQLKICSVADIAEATGINNRSVQSAIGDLVRKKRLIRMPGGRHQVRKYRLPNVKKYDPKSA